MDRKKLTITTLVVLIFAILSKMYVGFTFDFRKIIYSYSRCSSILKWVNYLNQTKNTVVSMSEFPEFDRSSELDADDVDVSALSAQKLDDGLGLGRQSFVSRTHAPLINLHETAKTAAAVDLQLIIFCTSSTVVNRCRFLVKHST